LHFDSLKTENSALLGCSDIFVNGSHKFIDFLGFLKPSPQLSPFFWPKLFNCLPDFSSRDLSAACNPSPVNKRSKRGVMKDES
jgi:hypothetical protein